VREGIVTVLSVWRVEVSVKNRSSGYPRIVPDDGVSVNMIELDGLLS
jgi:hypothetical protein